MSWETVIGLEVHAQLLTASKLFSKASTSFGQKPNTSTSLLDAGLPGVLPVINKKAVSLAVLFGKAVNATINEESVFERKNYFYPDLPKGYQISQFQQPIVKNGILTIDLKEHGVKNIDIQRAHLEEDAGKSIYDEHTDCSAVDLNRAGIALIEIVTAPCISSAFEAVTYLRKLQQLLRFLRISDGNMQEGSFRCDVNISVRPKGSDKLGVRTELKNLNSFRFIEKAILIEQQRHIKYLEQGKALSQETRSYNPDKNITLVMRSKEKEQDYRYFPDPDLLPIKIDLNYLNSISIPDLPDVIHKDLSNILAENEIEFLLSNPDTYDYFCAIKNISRATPKIIVNWLQGPIQAYLNEAKKSYTDNILPQPTVIGKLLDKLIADLISYETAKKIFLRLMHEPLEFEKIYAQELENSSMDISSITDIVVQILNNHPDEVQQFKDGKKKLLGFFVGQTLKQLQGKGDAKVINEIVQKALKDF